MVKVTTTNIVGTASKNTWSQSRAIVYSDDHLVMVVIKLSCEDSDSLIDLAAIGVEILAEVERKGQAIESAVQLNTLFEDIVNGVTEGLTISILIGSTHDSKLTLVGQGEVDGYLSRNGQLAKLKDNWDDGENIEGSLIENDVLVMTTSEFIEVVSLPKFKEILTQEESPSEFLAPLVHTEADSSGIALIVAEAMGAVKPQVSNWLKNILSREPKIHLRDENPRKINLWVGGVILILLAIMIGVGMVRRVKLIAERDFTSLSTSISSKLEETLSVGDLNPERARYLLTQARSEVDAYLLTDIKDEYKQRASKLISEIDLADERAFKKNDIKLSTVVEFSILVDGMKAEKMKSDGRDNLIFNDGQGSRIISMNLIDRSRQVIEASKSENYVDLGVSDTHVYGLDKSGVTELFWKKSDSKKMIEADEFWKDPTLIEMFAGNAYILDREQGEIWKYPTLGDTFGGRRRWFAAGITPDLTNVVDMKVVGDVWLLTSTGKLERYSRGAPVSFGMEGFPAKAEAKKLSEPSAIWVTDSLVYVLENGASRVVVFGTDGKYQSQYTNSEFAKATDLVMVNDKGYVIIDNMIKEFGL